MRKHLNIFVIAVILIVGQACGSKSENNNEEPVVIENAVSNADAAVNRAEERAKLQKAIEEWEVKRSAALLELAKTTPTYKDENGNIIYNKAEVEPVFGDGRGSLAKYLNENLIYPEEAKKDGLEGTIFVDFIVAANGSVREAVVSDATNEKVDQQFRNEAIRVVTAMPNWTPGLQHEKPVDVKFSLPITFQFD